MFPRPLTASVRLRCGRCGKGKLFGAYLKFKDECENCGQDLTIADTADGPAFFVSFLSMILFVPFFFMLTLMNLGTAVKLALVAVVLAIMIGFCLGILPIFKALFLNLQIEHRAEEAQFESTGKHGSAPKNWKG